MPEQPRSERRPDIMLYLNGPVVVVAACRHGTWSGGAGRRSHRSARPAATLG
ncbi:MAG TPA: hypothetical protein P5032_06510 [Candidatus Competibacter sp.]|nr:hypothetical protein [Candidatus Competibacter sp.]